MSPPELLTTGVEDSSDAEVMERGKGDRTGQMGLCGHRILQTMEQSKYSESDHYLKKTYDMNDYKLVIKASM